MDVGGLAISLFFSVGTCAGGGWWCIRRLSEARFLLNTPTSKIRSAAQGYVELYGVLHAHDEGEVRAPLSGTSCLWWRFKVEEYSEQGKRRSWRVLESGTSEAWLRLRDATGECLINPRGAEVRPVVRETWYGNERRPMGNPNGPSLGLFGMLLGGSGHYRYIEERLHADQPLYAIGNFRTLGGAEAFDLTQAQGEVIREWKSDFAGLLQRFDVNGDGQLDTSEWERMRQSARAEAQRRHAARGEAPVHHQLSRPGESYPFILSNSGEDELARRFYWQAAGGAIVCLIGALATAWLVSNVLIPGLAAA
ncbi:MULTISPECIES: GIDE domain-containing protein [unclassified Pseudomonas]|uniref:GIDE domain-containing protein n=1 Tax=unclassified Pseudomonas TaxID=196821 RepID=UPI00244A8E44|nr:MULTISPECIES: GIDE domain-containing protein [unclassified Pseudomonas]MDG9928308.1 E3 ubiquitin ligase family protein [Pseudomonas sp. GD04042]MDH0481128.1 E3 ubiquitin ligase family protein [Pseudomonas sp. GD04015]MDH0604464.1 E3 ubiquitin ligase family protein [Pseudomonas sp. GD03869]